MRKEPGFGAEYQHLRTGEWEYVAYRPDKSVQTAPRQSNACANCHRAAGESRDWVFRPDLVFEAGQSGRTPDAGPNEVVIASVAYTPRELTAKPGTSITWSNQDVTRHTVTTNDRSLDSGVIPEGGSFAHTFTAPGTYQYLCTIHPEQMRGTVQATN